MPNFKSYLEGRIKDLQQFHSNCKAEAEKATEEVVRLGYNSQAAGAWDTLCEVKDIKAKYEACHPEADCE